MESQFRSDWTIAPLLNNLWFRNTALHAPQMAVAQALHSGGPRENVTQALLEAAEDLYAKLSKGTYVTEAGDVKRLNGDTFKLMYARGITPLQRQLLANLHFLSSSIPGTQDIRRQMGQHMRGATIIYGQPIFLTISPSERHSSKILRLSRFRTCETLFQSMSSDEVKAQ